VRGGLLNIVNISVTMGRRVEVDREEAVFAWMLCGRAIFPRNFMRGLFPFLRRLFASLFFSLGQPLFVLEIFVPPFTVNSGPKGL
jgi:hypothetical protein